MKYLNRQRAIGTASPAGLTLVLLTAGLALAIAWALLNYKFDGFLEAFIAGF